MDMTTGTAKRASAGPTYRLPAQTRVGGVRLRVADLERSLAFYTRVLGFRGRDSGAGRATLSAADGERPLIELEERRGAAPVPPRGRLGLFHFAILLPDRAALGRLIAHLAELSVRIGAADHLVSEAIYLADPDGLGIEVYADRPRAAWRYQAGELAMDTLPLDLGGLRREAGGKTWSGMPAGTTIGHVHLSVADLVRADDFYHRGLGLDRVVWSYPGALFLSAGGYHHHLGVNTWAAGAPQAGEDDARLLEWELLLPGAADVSAAAGSLAAAGYVVQREKGSATATDPWGTRVRIVPA